jgi:iron complex outermembrane receptor protein
VSRGYKPGGTNLNQTPNLVQTTFQPESLDAFEIGSKNRFFDKAATANFAAFYYNYNNFQFIGDDPVPYQGGVANIPTAHSYGVEADFGTRLPFDLRLDGNAALLHSEITSNYYALDSTAADAAVAAAGCGPYDTACLTLARSGAVKNIKGNPLPKMPSFAGSLALTHTYATSDGGAFTSRIQVVYQGNYVYRVFNNSALDTVPSYGLWNLYFGYTTPKGDWNFSLTGTNILNTNAISSRFTNAWGLNGTTANQYVPPQQVIARVSYQF